MTAPTILIVDDDASFRRVLEYQLTEAGFSVIPAEDGRKALDAFSQNRVHAILTDLNMPDISGIDLLKAIQQQSPDIPVIVLTACGSIDLVVEAMKSGASHCLAKPMDKNVLLHTLEQALKLSGQLAENRNIHAAVSSHFTFEEF